LSPTPKPALLAFSGQQGAHVDDSAEQPQTAERENEAGSRLKLAHVPRYRRSRR